MRQTPSVEMGSINSTIISPSLSKYFSVLEQKLLYEDATTGTIGICALRKFRFLFSSVFFSGSDCDFVFPLFDSTSLIRPICTDIARPPYQVLCRTNFADYRLNKLMSDYSEITSKKDRSYSGRIWKSENRVKGERGKRFSLRSANLISRHF